MEQIKIVSSDIRNTERGQTKDQAATTQVNAALMELQQEGKTILDIELMNVDTGRFVYTIRFNDPDLDGDDSNE